MKRVLKFKHKSGPGHCTRNGMSDPPAVFKSLEDEAQLRGGVNLCCHAFVHTCCCCGLECHEYVKFFTNHSGTHLWEKEDQGRSDPCTIGVCCIELE